MAELNLASMTDESLRALHGELVSELRRAPSPAQWWLARHHAVALSSALPYDGSSRRPGQLRAGRAGAHPPGPVRRAARRAGSCMRPPWRRSGRALRGKWPAARTTPSFDAARWGSMRLDTDAYHPRTAGAVSCGAATSGTDGSPPHGMRPGACGGRTLAGATWDGAARRFFEPEGAHLGRGGLKAHAPSLTGAQEGALRRHREAPLFG